MQQVLSHKRKCFKVRKAGGDRDTYQAAKRASNLAVHIAKSDAEKIAFKQINPKSVEIYRLAKQMRRENQDVIGDKPVRNNNGQMSLDVDSKKKHGESIICLLNVEFSWNSGGLPEIYPVEGPSEPITTAMVRKAINKMSLGKAASFSGIVAEMFKAAGPSGASMIRDLIKDIIFENHILSEWQESHIVSVYKGKDDALNRSNYRGLKLIHQVIKVLEHVVKGFIRQRVVINDMQCGFMQGRSTTDAIYIYPASVTGIKGSLTSDLNFRCARCLSTARPVDGRLVKEVMIGDEKLEVVSEFCYLGNMLSAGSGCELASITRCKSSWAEFRQLLPLLANRHLLLLAVSIQPVSKEL